MPNRIKVHACRSHRSNQPAPRDKAFKDISREIRVQNHGDSAEIRPWWAMVQEFDRVMDRFKAMNKRSPA